LRARALAFIKRCIWKSPKKKYREPPDKCVLYPFGLRSPPAVRLTDQRVVVRAVSSRASPSGSNKMLY